MEYRTFGSTDLKISTVGFGAWAIGGPAHAGHIPIGWGKVDDRISVRAIHEAVEQGINFFDTADFYGLGHSETLLGTTLGNRDGIIIATKAGHRLNSDDRIFTDYTPEYIRKACEASLRRLKRETIDFFQLHTAKVQDLENKSLPDQLELLKSEGKIRYWGVSLHTWEPRPEAEYIFSHKIGEGLQLVLNILNQRAIPLLGPAASNGYGIIARMPLQFGLLTGKFTEDTRFEQSDHRQTRLSPPVLKKVIPALSLIRDMAEAYQTSMTSVSLSFILSFPEVSTVIPGIKTPEQARQNASSIVQLSTKDKKRLMDAYINTYASILEDMEQLEKS
jgi:aryl-alcohol dehydrogenase-like predicted oxidoreductase